MNELLNKYFNGTLSDLEKNELFGQINKDNVLKEEFAKIQNAWAISGMARQKDDEKWIVDKYEELRQIIRRRKRKSFCLSLAKYGTVAALFICLWFIFRHNSLPENVEDFTYIEAPTGQRVFLTLADGSKVWLNSRSKLKFSNDFNKTERIVELDGEGFFSVHKNEQKPFTVKTKQYDIKVTGTEFNVFAYAASPIFETELVNGSVSIYNRKEVYKALQLSPKEKGYAEQGELRKSTHLFNQCRHIENGIYSFENTSLLELIKRLELWYDVKFEIANPQVAECTFEGKFRQADNIENVLNAIKETGKFNYRLKDKELIEIY
jgi:ferric-dicitrate binding protein FerR (iron transport regulator)